MRRFLALLFLSPALRAAAKSCDGTDLPPDGDVRIGVKHRPEECERKAGNGDKVTVKYAGKLYSSCEEFDSGEDFKFLLGKGEVIPGWEKGVRGMCVGEKRKLTIPSELAYGAEGSGELIPGGATLIFEVEMAAIEDGPAEEEKKKKKKKKKKKSKKSKKKKADEDL